MPACVRHWYAMRRKVCRKYVMTTIRYRLHLFLAPLPATADAAASGHREAEREESSRGQAAQPRKRNCGSEGAEPTVRRLGAQGNRLDCGEFILAGITDSAHHAGICPKITELILSDANRGVGGRRLSAALPGCRVRVAAATCCRCGMGALAFTPADSRPRRRRADIWRSAGSPDVRHAVAVIGRRRRYIEARVHCLMDLR